MTDQKMHADEVDIDVSLVRQLLAEQFPQWAKLPIEPVKSAGTSNAIYRLGDEMSARLPRIPSAVDNVNKEYEWVPKLAPFLPIAVPIPLAKGSPNANYPWHWTVCKWLDGSNPEIDNLTDPNALATDLARFVNALHQIDLPGGPSTKRGVPLAIQDSQARNAIQALQGKIDMIATTAIWETSLKLPSWDGPPVWIHGDLMPGNMLVKDGKLSAVIDFGCLGVGDPASDMIPVWNLLPSSARNTYRETVQVNDATWARGRGWAFSMALIQLPYYEHTNPEMAANARHVISEVLADS